MDILNEMKASMLIMSHLSDSQELIGFMCGSSAIEEINFAKFVLMKHPNTNDIVNAGELWKEFEEWKKNRK